MSKVKDIERMQKKRHRIIKQKLDELEEWIFENNRLPKSSSKDKIECKMAKYMLNIFSQMKEEPDVYSQEIMEYKQILAQYTIIKKTVTDEYERDKTSLIGQPERYLQDELEEEQRNNVALKQHFEVWKNWTIEHGITPSQYSRDSEEEQKVAQNMCTALNNIKKQPDKYEDILKEYEQLYEQYGRQKMRSAKTLLKHFETWKQWTISHEITPSVNSEDKIEQKIARYAARALLK